MPMALNPGIRRTPNFDRVPEIRSAPRAVSAPLPLLLMPMSQIPRLPRSFQIKADPSALSLHLRNRRAVGSTEVHRSIAERRRSGAEFQRHRNWIAVGRGPEHRGESATETQRRRYAADDQNMVFFTAVYNAAIHSSSEGAVNVDPILNIIQSVLVELTS
jgi:hypothetical protein